MPSDSVNVKVEPEFYRFGDNHELCRFPSGSWSLRYLINGDPAHVRYLDEHEQRMVEAVRSSHPESREQAPLEAEGEKQSIHAYETDEWACAAGVLRFSAAMRSKLDRKRQDGRGGWNKPDECSVEFLRQLLDEHVRKGDPVDIANICMMIWNRENPKGLSNGEDDSTAYPAALRGAAQAGKEDVTWDGLTLVTSHFPRDLMAHIRHNYTVDDNGDPSDPDAQPESEWEIGYAAGVRSMFRDLKDYFAARSLDHDKDAEKICEELAKRNPSSSASHAQWDCVAAIRATRKTKAVPNMVMVPRTITEVEADALGVPVAFYSKTIGHAAILGQPYTPPDSYQCGFGDEPNAVPQVPHGVCRADDPNSEATQRAGSSTKGHKPGAPSAVVERERGDALSVSHDEHGTETPAGTAPSSARAELVEIDDTVEMAIREAVRKLREAMRREAATALSAREGEIYEDEFVKQAVRNLVEDIRLRSGLGDAWDMADDEIQDEIKEKWAEAIRAAGRRT